MSFKTTFFGRRIGYNEEKRKQIRKSKVKSGVKKSLLWFRRRGWIIAILILALVVLGWSNRFYLQRFNPVELRYLQYIDIEGNRMLTWEDIVESAQIEPGMLLSEVFEDSVEKKLMQLPLIHKAKVEKHFPSSISIKLQEATPLMAYFNGGKASVYSERGLLLPIPTSNAYHLPVVDDEVFNRIEEVAVLLRELKSLKPNLYNLVSQISWSKKDNCYEVYFSDVGYKVLLPENSWKKSLWDLYESVKQDFSKDLICAREVDLRYRNFLYIRNYDKRCVNG